MKIDEISELILKNKNYTNTLINILSLKLAISPKIIQPIIEKAKLNNFTPLFDIAQEIQSLPEVFDSEGVGWQTIDYIIEKNTDYYDLTECWASWYNDEETFNEVKESLEHHPDIAELDDEVFQPDGPTTRYYQLRWRIKPWKHKRLSTFYHNFLFEGFRDDLCRGKFNLELDPIYMYFIISTGYKFTTKDTSLRYLKYNPNIRITGKVKLQNCRVEDSGTFRADNIPIHDVTGHNYFLLVRESDLKLIACLSHGFYVDHQPIKWAGYIFKI